MDINGKQKLVNWRVTKAKIKTKCLDAQECQIAAQYEQNTYRIL
jgi:hypothetical protein